MTMKRISGLLLATLLLGLSACAGVTEEDVLPPKVSLADVRFLDGSAFQQQLLLELRVGNPNNFDISLEGLSFSLEVNGAPFADGLSNEDVTLPRLADTRVPVTATTTLVDLVRQALLLSETGEISFLLEGHAFVTNGLGSRRVPFGSEGNLKLLPDGERRNRGERRFVPI